MILGLGLNTAFTLNSASSSFFPIPTDLGLETYGVDEIVWTSWGATVGLERSTQTYKIWGYSPVVYIEGLTTPRKITLPSGVVPKFFIGTDNLEAILGEDGFIYLPSEGDDSKEHLWQKVAQDNGGWLAVGMLGSGACVGLHSYDPSTPIYTSSLSALCGSAPPAPVVNQPAHIPTFIRIHPSLSHSLLTPSLPAIHPPYAQGSNLHAQLSLSGSTSSDVPVRLEQFDGLGAIKLSSAGVYSSGLTEAGEIYVWGGRYGCLDEALDVPRVRDLLRTQPAGLTTSESDELLERESDAVEETEEEEEEEEEEEVMDHVVTPFGGVLLVLRNGFVLGYNFDQADLMPASRPELLQSSRVDVGRSAWSIVWNPRDGLRVKSIKSGSGGRAVFYII